MATEEDASETAADDTSIGEVVTFATASAIPDSGAVFEESGAVFEESDAKL